MKTSNKILLGVLIVLILVITLIFLALSSKYEKGEYTIRRDMNNRDSVKLKPINYIKITGLQNVNIAPSYDFRLEIEKDMPEEFKYSLSGDTLILSGNNGKPEDLNREFRTIYQEVSVHVPHIKLIEVNNSNLGMSGKVDSSDVFPIRITLNRARLTFKNHIHVRDTAQYFGDVYIRASNQSEVEFFAKTLNFKSMSCDLDNSSYRDNETGNIQVLNINSNDSSTIQLSGKNIKKLGAAPRLVDSLRNLNK